MVCAHLPACQVIHVCHVVGDTRPEPAQPLLLPLKVCLRICLSIYAIIIGNSLSKVCLILNYYTSIITSLVLFVMIMVNQTLVAVWAPEFEIKHGGDLTVPELSVKVSTAQVEIALSLLPKLLLCIRYFFALPQSSERTVPVFSLMVGP